MPVREGGNGKTLAREIRREYIPGCGFQMFAQQGIRDLRNASLAQACCTRAVCDRVNANSEGANSNAMYVWPREFNNRRKRDFIVEMLRSFWQKYRTMKPSERTFYELIRA